MAKKIYDYSPKILEEIFMMALTYRVSLRNLCLMFMCNIIDLETAIKKVPNLSNFIEDLDKCTINESKEFQLISLKNAKTYWKKRQNLIKGIKNAKNTEEKNKLKEELNKHRSLIYDVDVRKVIDRDNYQLTDEQKEQIARCRVKYSLTVLKTSEVFKVNHNLIRELCSELALKDHIYAKQLEAVNLYNESWLNIRKV